MKIEDQVKEIENIIFQKFAVKVKVTYDYFDNLGKWFYLERKNSPYGNYRLGTTLHNAVSMVGFMESIPSGVETVE